MYIKTEDAIISITGSAEHDGKQVTPRPSLQHTVRVGYLGQVYLQPVIGFDNAGFIHLFHF